MGMHVLIAIWPSPMLLSMQGLLLTQAQASQLIYDSPAYYVQDFLFHTHKQVSPHLATAKKHGIKAWAQSKKHGWKAWVASKKHTNTFLSSPQVSILLTDTVHSTLSTFTWVAAKPPVLQCEGTRVNGVRNHGLGDIL